MFPHKSPFSAHFSLSAFTLFCFVADMPRSTARAGSKRKREAPKAAAVPVPSQPSAIAVPEPTVLQLPQTLAERTTRSLAVYMLIASHTQGSTALLDYAKAHSIDWSAFVGDLTLLGHLFWRREIVCDATLLPFARGLEITLSTLHAKRSGFNSAFAVAMCSAHPGWAFDLVYHLTHVLKSEGLMSGGLPARCDKKDDKVIESVRGGPTDVETEDEAKSVGSIVFAAEMKERLARGADAMLELKGMCVEGVVWLVTGNGFFMKCGEQEFFVAALSMPRDYVFDAVRQDRFVSDEDPDEFEPMVIKAGTKVRARVIALRHAEGEGVWVALASLMDDYLGPMSNHSDSEGEDDDQDKCGSAGTEEHRSQ